MTEKYIIHVKDKEFVYVETLTSPNEDIIKIPYDVFLDWASDKKQVLDCLETL